MSRSVLDSSAILALIHREPGAEIVAETLPEATVSAVNLAEVATHLSDRKMPGSVIRATLADLSLHVVDFDQESAFAAGAMRAVTRHAGLSLGDRACLALAARTEMPVLTADRAWIRLDIGVEVRLIR